MPTFNKLFPTQRLLQIILVLGATVIMKLLSYSFAARIHGKRGEAIAALSQPRKSGVDLMQIAVDQTYRLRLGSNPPAALA